MATGVPNPFRLFWALGFGGLIIWAKVALVLGPICRFIGALGPFSLFSLLARSRRDRLTLSGKIPLGRPLSGKTLGRFIPRAASRVVQGSATYVGRREHPPLGGWGNRVWSYRGGLDQGAEVL